MSLDPDIRKLLKLLVTAAFVGFFLYVGFKARCNAADARRGRSDIPVSEECRASAGCAMAENTK